MTTLPLSVLPTFAGVTIDTAEITEQQITPHAHTTAPQVRCPTCTQAAYRVHSAYVRTLADLPWSGLPVRLVLRVRRFRCATATCPRRTFAEQVPQLTQPHAQRTSRLNGLLQIVGVAVGGEPGHRICGHLSTPTSADTLLRRVRQLPPPAVPTPRVLGVDDWAKRKGRTYGTLLVGLEQRRRVDLLPDATPAQFAAWLHAHPGVEVIARDRGPAYVEGATNGAPHAIQIADRWHLTCNLGEAVHAVLHRHTAALHTAARRLHGSVTIAPLSLMCRHPCRLPSPKGTFMVPSKSGTINSTGSKPCTGKAGASAASCSISTSTGVRSCAMHMQSRYPAACCRKPPPVSRPITPICWSAGRPAASRGSNCRWNCGRGATTAAYPASTGHSNSSAPRIDDEAAGRHHRQSHVRCRRARRCGCWCVDPTP